MFNCLLKNLGGKYLNKTLRYRFMSYKNENIIGGGLDKPQGGLKEEKYFSEQNHELMLKIRDHGTKLKKECLVGKCSLDFSDNRNIRTALRDSYSTNKQKNCLEEAFFLNEHTECCTNLYKQNCFKKIEAKKTTKSELEGKNPYNNS